MASRKKSCEKKVEKRQKREERGQEREHGGASRNTTTRTGRRRTNRRIQSPREARQQHVLLRSTRYSTFLLKDRIPLFRFLSISFSFLKIFFRPFNFDVVQSQKKNNETALINLLLPPSKEKEVKWRNNFSTMASRKKSEKREKMKKRWRREGGRSMIA